MSALQHFCAWPMMRTFTAVPWGWLTVQYGCLQLPQAAAAGWASRSLRPYVRWSSLGASHLHLAAVQKSTTALGPITRYLNLSCAHVCGGACHLQSPSVRNLPDMFALDLSGRAPLPPTLPPPPPPGAPPAGVAGGGSHGGGLSSGAIVAVAVGGAAAAVAVLAAASAGRTLHCTALHAAMSWDRSCSEAAVAVLCLIITIQLRCCCFLTTGTSACASAPRSVHAPHLPCVLTVWL